LQPCCGVEIDCLVKLSQSEKKHRLLLQRLGFPVEKPPGRSHIWLENEVTHEWKISNCRSWNCERCAPKMSAIWAGKILEEHVDYFLTMTLVPEELEEATKAWRSFAERWRTRWGDFEAVKFTERGKKNAMKHYHVLIRCAAPRIDLAWLRWTLEQCGYGLQNKIRRLKGDEHRRRTIWYCAKYCTKAGTLGFLETERKVNTTQGFFTAGASLTQLEREENLLWKIKDAQEHIHSIPVGIGDPTPVSMEEIQSRADALGVKTLERSQKLLAKQRLKESLKVKKAIG